MPYSPSMKQEWITQTITDEAIEWTNKFAKHLAPQNRDDKNALSTSQLRKFFGPLRQIQADYEKLKKEIPLLKPKLAYAVGRADNQSRIRDFYEQMEIGLKNLNGDKERFNRFVSFVESIVAFHKYHGGS